MRATSLSITRFTDEVNRFYGVLNNKLYDQRYLWGSIHHRRHDLLSVDGELGRTGPTSMNLNTSNAGLTS